MNTDRFLCRAKDVKSGKWVEGAYYKHLPYTPGCGVIAPEKDYKHLIIRDGVSDWSMPRGLDCYEIDPKTLEQCTGLKDRNGKLIYEGDVLRFASQIDICVTFRNGGFVYSLTEDEKLAYRLTQAIAKETQIIGNIHDDQFRDPAKKVDGKDGE